MASPAPFFGEAPPKKRRPAVPTFGKISAPGGLSVAEYERRLKAGVLDPATPMPGTTSSVPQTQTLPQVKASWPPPPPPSEVPSAAPVECGTTVPSAAPVESGTALSDTAPAASSGTTASDAAVPIAGPTPRASDHHASPDAPAAPAEPESISDSTTEGLGSRPPKVGQRHSGVYGLSANHALQTREATRKAIALRLEPLREGLPNFEQVLSEGRQTVTIGSKRNSCDVVVIDEAVSKTHCALTLVGVHGELALSIVDHSTNGTFVNGKRLPVKGKRYRIRSGDSIQVKDISLQEDYGWKCDFGNTVSYFQRA